MSGVLALLAASATSCILPTGWDAVEARGARYVIFGELHGTQQAPDFVGDVVCALVRQKRRVLLALEISSSEDVDLQAAWARPAGRFAAAAAATVGDWGADRAGGPMSQATFDMLDCLHRYKESGSKLDVVAFNGARDDAQRSRFSALPGQGPHEAAQAENIRIAAARAAYDKVLVGDVHARKRAVPLRGVWTEPMAMRLAPAAKVRSLNISFSGETAFKCQMRPGSAIVAGAAVTSAAIDCRPYTIAGDTTRSGAPRIEVGATLPEPDRGAFDGLFWIGSIEAARPVRNTGQDSMK